MESVRLEHASRREKFFGIEPIAWQIVGSKEHYPRPSESELFPAIIDSKLLFWFWDLLKDVEK
jgi:hypothetical protein